MRVPDPIGWEFVTSGYQVEDTRRVKPFLNPDAGEKHASFTRALNFVTVSSFLFLLDGSILTKAMHDRKS